jgi:hypothetical protein
MDPRLKRTAFAARAATLAEQFQSAVSDIALGQHRAEMTAPEASTGGGVQALQHIRLVPKSGQGRIYVVGNANRIQRVAELRTLTYVDTVSEERWGELSGLDPTAYAAFLTAATECLEMLGCKVTRVDVAPRSMRPPAPAPPRSSIWLQLVLGLVLLALGCGIGLLLRR